MCWIVSFVLRMNSERMVEKKKDYIDKLESGEADVEDMDKEEMEDVLDDLEDELEEEELHKTS